MSARRVLPCTLALLLALATSCPRGAHAFGAEGCEQSVTCDGVRTGKDATAIGYQSSASGDYAVAIGYQADASGSCNEVFGHHCYGSTALGYKTTALGVASTAMGLFTNATGIYSTAMGISTTASSYASTAMGDSTTASGIASTAMGSGTTASGAASTAMGSDTTASACYSTAMGNNVEAQEQAALVNSGSIHGKKLGFVADARLAADVRKADLRALLAAVAALRVVTHAPSANCCAHQNRTAADCAGARTVGLLAQDVARVVPEAVSAPASLTLARRSKGPHRANGEAAGVHGANASRCLCWAGGGGGGCAGWPGLWRAQGSRAGRGVPPRCCPHSRPPHRRGYAYACVRAHNPTTPPPRMQAHIRV